MMEKHTKFKDTQSSEHYGMYLEEYQDIMGNQTKAKNVSQDNNL